MIHQSNTKASWTHAAPEWQANATKKQLIEILWAGDDEKITNAEIIGHVEDILAGDTKRALHYMKNSENDIFHLLPTELKNNPKIIEQALAQDHTIFWTLNEAQKNTKSIYEQALDTILAWWNLYEAITFFSKWHGKLAQMKKYFQKKYWKDASLTKNLNEKQLFELYFSYPEIYTLLTEKGIITVSDDGLSLWQSVKKYIASNKQRYISGDIQEVHETIFQDILGQFSLSQSEIKKIWVSLLRDLIVTIPLAQFVEKNDEDNELWDDDWEDDVESLEEETYPLIYSTSGAQAIIWDESWKSAPIEEKFLENMNDTSMKNFIEFYSRVQELWLAFLIKKHASKIQTATGVNFYADQGMTPWKTLKFLNSIAKNIGVPEKDYEDADGNKKIECFDTLSWAMLEFKNIKSTGNINNKPFVDVSQIWDYSVVELYMKYKHLIGWPYNELSIPMWK